jgi:hypothetical protein
MGLMVCQVKGREMLLVEMAVKLEGEYLPEMGTEDFKRKG